MLTLKDIEALFLRRGHEQYSGEPVTQLQHALQTAALAEADGADDELATAALLHDLGHLVHELGDGLGDDYGYAHGGGGTNGGYGFGDGWGFGKSDGYGGGYGGGGGYSNGDGDGYGYGGSGAGGWGNGDGGILT